MLYASGMAITDAQLLALIEARISEGGFVRSYSINGRSVTNESLSDMLKVWRELQSTTATSSNGGVNFVRFTNPV